MAAPGRDFYSELPVFRRFEDLVDPSVYQRLPDDWLVGLSDVVNSSAAIAAGRYKVVNTAGAAVIAAMTNALRRREFPFAFGGDGSSFAVSPPDGETARRVLASTAAWARDELDLTLRIALVPLAAVRERGFDVRVARFAPSRNVSYAMFTGGGIAWAEQAMKEGRFMLPPGPAGARPDLTGLSCRWQEMTASRELILSLVLIPLGNGDRPAFRELVAETLARIEQSEAAVSPVGESGPKLGSPALGLGIEARITRPAGASLVLHGAALLVRRVIAFLIFLFGIPAGRFDPTIYRRELAENSDFRKYDDGLRMTLDCTTAFADDLEARFRRAEARKVARFGLHRQPAAIMTCITPSQYDSRHVHFVDGAAGGYAAAMSRLKPSGPAG